MFSTWRSVLLVEDEPLLRELAEQALTRANHRVVAVSNCAEARHALHAQPFDVLVTDYSLADGVTGIDLAAEFRAMVPSMTVVVMTGYDVETLRCDAGVGLDSIGFLQKPFRMDDLVEMVDRSPSQCMTRLAVENISRLDRAEQTEGAPGVMA